MTDLKRRMESLTTEQIQSRIEDIETEYATPADAPDAVVAEHLALMLELTYRDLVDDVIEEAKRND